jgi:hypothetical protein
VATVENRTGTFRVIFCHAGRRHTAGLQGAAHDAPYLLPPPAAGSYSWSTG